MDGALSSLVLYAADGPDAKLWCLLVLLTQQLLYDNTIIVVSTSSAFDQVDDPGPNSNSREMSPPDLFSAAAARFSRASLATMHPIVVDSRLKSSWRRQGTSCEAIECPRLKRTS